MLTYRVIFRQQLGAFVVDVADFPEASSFGATLMDARNNLLNSLRFAAETRLRRGELLPIPDATRPIHDAYAVEEVILLPEGEHRVGVRVK